MDRHSRVFAGGCLAAIMGIVVTGSGCRSMRNDVPPGSPIRRRAAALRRSALTRILIPILRLHLAFTATA